MGLAPETGSKYQEKKCVLEPCNFSSGHNEDHILLNCRVMGKRHFVFLFCTINSVTALLRYPTASSTSFSTPDATHSRCRGLILITTRSTPPENDHSNRWHSNPLRRRITSTFLLSISDQAQQRIRRSIFAGNLELQDTQKEAV